MVHFKDVDKLKTRKFCFNKLNTVFSLIHQCKQTTQSTWSRSDTSWLMWSMTDVFSSSNSTPHSLPNSRMGSPKECNKSLLSYGAYTVYLKRTSDLSIFLFVQEDQILAQFIMFTKKMTINWPIAELVATRTLPPPSMKSVIALTFNEPPNSTNRRGTFVIA